MQIMPPALLSFSMVTCGHYHHSIFALRWNAHVSIFDSFWLIFSWLLTTQCVTAFQPSQMTVDDMTKVSEVGWV